MGADHMVSLSSLELSFLGRNSCRKPKGWSRTWNKREELRGFALARGKHRVLAKSLKVRGRAVLGATAEVSSSELDTLTMETTLDELSAANEVLRVEIADLRETVACLDVENQELLNENKSLKDKNKTLQETADSFRTIMEEMQQKVEEVREKTDHANGKICHLDLQNKSLVKAKEELTKELHEVSGQVALFKDYKAAQERDLLEMQNLSVEVKKYLRSLEDKLEETEQRYQAEKSRSAQLREKVGELLLNRENQRKGIKDLQGQVELSLQQATILRMDQENNVQVGSLMHEIMEARLVDVALNRSRKRKIMHWLWRTGQFLTILVFGCGLLLGLAFLYTYFINQQFISDTVLVLLSDESIQKIAEVLSQYLTLKNDGLLPF